MENKTSDIVNYAFESIIFKAYEEIKRVNEHIGACKTCKDKP